MAKQKANESSFGPLELTQNEQGFKKELEAMADSYYQYLMLPLFTTGELFSDSASMDIFIRELAKADSLLNKGETLALGFIADTIDSPFVPKPKIGMRRLPDFFIKDHKIYDANIWVISKNEIKVWAEKDYDILYGIAISQCKAIRKYKETLEEKIKVLKSPKLARERNATGLTWNSSRIELMDIFHMMAEESFTLFGILLNKGTKEEINEFIDTYFKIKDAPSKYRKTGVDINFQYNGDTGALIRLFYYLTKKISPDTKLPYITYDQLSDLHQFLHRGFIVRDEKAASGWSPIKIATIKRTLTRTQKDFGNNALKIYDKEKSYKNKSHGLIKYLTRALDNG